MQWLIDLIIEAIGIPPVFINRGDPAINDYTQADLVQDGTWRELDLSGIVPENATAVLLAVFILDAAISKNLQFRRSGNVNDKNISVIATQVALVLNFADLIVFLSSDRKIEYKAPAAGIAIVVINIKGWCF